MTSQELIARWENGEIAKGVYTTYTLEDDVNVVVEVEDESITLKFLEGRFFRCKTYYKDSTEEEWFC